MTLKYKAEVSLSLTPNEALLVKSVFQNTPEYLSDEEKSIFYSIFAKLPDFSDLHLAMLEEG